MKSNLRYNYLIFLFFCLAILAQNPPLLANQIQEEEQEYAYISPNYSAGMFSHFLMLLGFLHSYELGIYSGIKLDFEDRGFYYDSSYGLNWWEYYFEPIEIGEVKNATIKKYQDNECIMITHYATRQFTREKAFKLIQKYIKVKSDIQEEVEDFILKEFQEDFILGIHYRGTDKITSGEADFVPYGTVLQAVVDQLMKKSISSHYKIFIATDEIKFLNYMKLHFPDQVIHLDAIRSISQQGVHTNSKAPYQIGKEALMDALLLSRCDYLIRTHSNLSLCASHFNPSLPVIVLE